MSQRPGRRPASGPGSEAESSEFRPLLTVVRGEPTAAELAALTVVVDALVRRGDTTTPAQGRAGSGWAARPQLMRPQLRPGPGAWRASALPQ